MRMVQQMLETRCICNAGLGACRFSITLGMLPVVFFPARAVVGDHLLSDLA